MKSFIDRLLKFTLFLLLFWGAIFAINVYRSTCTSCIDQESGIKYLFAGDSHIEKSMDDRLIEGSLNIAQPAENYPLTYYKLKKILKDQEFETVVIGFSPHNISSFNDLKFENHFSHEFYKRLYPIRFFQTPEVERIDELDYLRNFMRHFFLFPFADNCSYIGAYENSKRNKMGNLDETIARHFYDKEDQAYKVSEECVSYLDSIISLCQEHQVELILADTPSHDDYLTQIPEDMMLNYEQLAEELRVKGVRLFTDPRQYADSMFLDFDHLNQWGAEYYAKELSRELGAQ